MPSSDVIFPFSGISSWVNPHSIRIFRLHYTADPEKNEAWIAREKASMTDPAMAEQELEINFEAKQGQLVYHLTEEATLEPSFPIPDYWTRYFALDPHPRTPHAFLWIAVDNYGECYVYRELWPSRAYGLRGNVPETDDQFTVAEYIKTVKWLESPANDLQCANGELESKHLRHPERIWWRVIDYAARGFRNMAGADDQRTVQQQYEDESRKLDYQFIFRDAIKDHETGIAAVNALLRPRLVTLPDGTQVLKSKLHIFQDKCPELILQLRTNRYPQLTPTMAERRDPVEEPLQKRRHLTDDLRYIASGGMEYVEPVSRVESTWEPISPGVAY